jgi:hypothetical protein
MRAVIDAFSNNVDAEGKILYTKVHGYKANIAAGQSHTFRHLIMYANGVFFQGAEILQDIIGVSDFHVSVPNLIDGVPDGTYTSAEQYGYDVNLGTIKYIRESKYAAQVPMYVALECVYKNDTSVEQEVGVNFLMHERRDPPLEE